MSAVQPALRPARKPAWSRAPGALAWAAGGTEMSASTVDMLAWWTTWSRCALSDWYSPAALGDRVLEPEQLVDRGGPALERVEVVEADPQGPQPLLHVDHLGRDVLAAAAECTTVPSCSRASIAAGNEATGTRRTSRESRMTPFLS